MKRLEPETVGDVLRQTLQEQGMTGRLYETRAVAIWPAIVGEELAAMCGRPYVHNGVMTIHVRQASLRQELNMSRSVLARMLNEALRRDVISDLKFL